MSETIVLSASNGRLGKQKMLTIGENLIKSRGAMSLDTTGAYVKYTISPQKNCEFLKIELHGFGEPIYRLTHPFSSNSITFEEFIPTLFEQYDVSDPDNIRKIHFCKGGQA